MIPDIPPRPASLTRSSTLQECWLEPRPHLVHLLLQASTSGFARLPLSYARNGGDRLPRIMQARQCTVALRRVLLDSLVCHRMENGASRTLIWKTPLHFCWLRNCKVTSTRDSRGSTTNVCAADRRPACILEELHDTPCPGLAIVLVTCLSASQHYASREFEIIVGRQTVGPKQPPRSRASLPVSTAYTHPRHASYTPRGNSAGRQTHHPCSAREPTRTRAVSRMGSGKAARRRAQKTALPWEYDDAHCVAWLSPPVNSPR